MQNPGQSPYNLPRTQVRSPFIRQKETRRYDLTESAPRPTTGGTGILLASLLIAGFTMTVERKQPAEMAAWIVLGGLIGSVYMDFRSGGMRNLIRADLFAIAGLYFLTLFEFVFEQPEFHIHVAKASIANGVVVVLWGFAGLAIGRHLTNLRQPPFAELFVRPVSPKLMLTILWGSALLGYLHMLVAVNFNVVEMVYWFMEPRFSQPWTRGRLGDINALLTELNLLLYLIPPMAGIFLARRHRYSNFSLVMVALLFFFTLFYAFSSGTRNIFASFLLTFLIGYVFAMRPERVKELVALAVSAAVILLISTVMMLEFRTVGFKNWIDGVRSSDEPIERTLAVDYNLYAISQLTEVFPQIHNHLGFEVIYQAIIRPVPRFLWKGKPEGLSISIEEAVGAEGWTVATSFVGEAYMGFGLAGVFIISLALGAMIGWWGHLASPRNSEFGILIYASGFFAVGITMRSLFQLTTAILPTLGALVAGSILIQKIRPRKTGADAGFKR